MVLAASRRYSMLLLPQILRTVIFPRRAAIERGRQKLRWWRASTGASPRRYSCTWLKRREGEREGVGMRSKGYAHVRHPMGAITAREGCGSWRWRVRRGQRGTEGQRAAVCIKRERESVCV